MRDLRELRDEIDRIDRQLLPLFIERMELCGAVADYKKENKTGSFQRAFRRLPRGERAAAHLPSIFFAASTTACAS